MQECASFRAGCRPKVPGSTALSRIGCMVNGPLLNQLVCSPLRRWKVASVTTLAVKWSTISHKRSLEVALGNKSHCHEHSPCTIVCLVSTHRGKIRKDRKLC